MQNSDFRARITSLYGSQTSPVVLCMQNRVISTGILVPMVPDLTCRYVHANNVISFRITNLYGSQPSSVDLACKTATFGPELKVSAGPRHHLRFFAFKTASLAPELPASMGPSSHLWFFQAKQRLLE